jgi:hypothetical protein
MSIFSIWHFHDITEGPEEQRLQELEKQRHSVQCFKYVVTNPFLHVLPILFVQTKRKESLA